MKVLPALLLASTVAQATPLKDAELHKRMFNAGEAFSGLANTGRHSVGGRPSDGYLGSSENSPAFPPARSLPPMQQAPRVSFGDSLSAAPPRHWPSHSVPETVAVDEHRITIPHGEGTSSGVQADGSEVPRKSFAFQTSEITPHSHSGSQGSPSIRPSAGSSLATTPTHPGMAPLIHFEHPPDHPHIVAAREWKSHPWMGTPSSPGLASLRTTPATPGSSRLRSGSPALDTPPRGLSTPERLRLPERNQAQIEGRQWHNQLADINARRAAQAAAEDKQKGGFLRSPCCAFVAGVCVTLCVAGGVVAGLKWKRDVVDFPHGADEKLL